MFIKFKMKMEMHHHSIHSALNKPFVFANNLIMCHNVHIQEAVYINIFLVKVVSLNLYAN